MGQAAQVILFQNHNNLYCLPQSAHSENQRASRAEESGTLIVRVKRLPRRRAIAPLRNTAPGRGPVRAAAGPPRPPRTPRRRATAARVDRGCSCFASNTAAGALGRPAAFGPGRGASVGGYAKVDSPGWQQPLNVDRLTLARLPRVISQNRTIGQLRVSETEFHKANLQARTQRWRVDVAQ